MKLILFTFLFYFNFLFSSLVGEIPEAEKEVLLNVAKLLASSHTYDQNKVWPGYDLTTSPLVISFSSGHVFAFNMESENKEWQKLRLEGLNILYSPVDHWKISRTAFQPQFPLEGQTAYVFNLDAALSPNAFKSYEVMVHERFHRYQFDHFETFSAENYQDHLNLENLALGKLEEKILAEFMRDQGNIPIQLEHLRNFLAINAIRRIFLNHSSIDWEDHQQIMEGMADYVSYRIFDVFSILPDHNGYREITDVLKSEIINQDYSGHAIKWRHYSLGASLGYALDLLNVPDWKQRIQKGKSNLIQLLQEQLPMSSNEIKERIEYCLMKYQWIETKAPIVEAINYFLGEIENHRKAYQAIEGIAIEVGRPDIGLSGSGKNERLLYLADGSTLSINDTLASVSNDQLWFLKLDHMPYVFKKRSGQVEFKVEPETEVIIDGRKFILRDLMKENSEKTFTHLEIHGKQAEFNSDQQKGKLVTHLEGFMSVSF